MSATSTATPTPASSSASACSPDSLAALKEAFASFVRDPLSSPAWDRLQHAVEELSPADVAFHADLNQTRRHQLEKHGGFTQRFVLSKDVGPDGALRALPRPIPVRDETRRKLVHLVRNNPSSFPGGIQQLLNDERPLQQAKSQNYARLIATTIQCELDSLLKNDRTKLLKSAATVLDLSNAFRHLQRVCQAHPKVVETIDRRDTTAIVEFLVALGGRTPLTEAELTRMIQLAADDWKDAGDRDLIIRGRVLQTGLDGKTALLKTWVEPFAAELMFCGLLAELEGAFRKRLAAGVATNAVSAPAPSAPTRVPATSGTFSAPFRGGSSAPATSGSFTAPPSPRNATPSPPNLSDTAPVDMSSTGGFKVPIGVPEPPKLQVLRNYLRVSSTATVMRLSEAMRLAEARDDVVGHRQHVQQLFHEENWAIVGQTRGDSMFSRLRTAKSGAAPAN